MQIIPKESITPYLSLLLAINKDDTKKNQVHSDIVKVIRNNTTP